MPLFPFILRSTHNRILAEQAQVAALVITTLRDNNEALRKRELESHDYTTSRMADAIRAMDQLIFQMSQCLDWPTMRPYFNRLQAMTEARMRDESNRICDVMLPELKKTYLPKN